MTKMTPLDERVAETAASAPARRARTAGTAPEARSADGATAASHAAGPAGEAGSQDIAAPSPRASRPLAGTVADATAPQPAAAPAQAAELAQGAATAAEDRPTRPAMLHGFRRRCPHCGQGHLFEGYLKVTDRCAVCREELFHHRADDGPAYLTILVVGHLMAPLIHVVFTQFRPEPLVMATVFTVGCVALSLYLLPRLKGVVVGIQWARRMHGFGQRA